MAAPLARPSITPVAHAAYGAGSSQAIADCICLATKINAIAHEVLSHPAFGAEFLSYPENIESLRQHFQTLDDTFSSLISASDPMSGAFTTTLERMRGEAAEQVKELNAAKDAYFFNCIAHLGVKACNKMIESGSSHAVRAAAFHATYKQLINAKKALSAACGSKLKRALHRDFVTALARFALLGRTLIASGTLTSDLFTVNNDTTLPLAEVVDALATLKEKKSFSLAEASGLASFLSAQFAKIPAPLKAAMLESLRKLFGDTLEKADVADRSTYAQLHAIVAKLLSGENLTAPENALFADMLSYSGLNEGDLHPRVCFDHLLTAIGTALGSFAEATPINLSYHPASEDGEIKMALLLLKEARTAHLRKHCYLLAQAILSNKARQDAAFKECYNGILDDYYAAGNELPFPQNIELAIRCLEARLAPELPEHYLPLVEVGRSVYRAANSAVTPSAEIKERIKRDLKSLPRDVKSNIDGRYYARSNDAGKAGWGWGGAAHHIVDDLHTTLAAIEDVLEEIFPGASRELSPEAYGDEVAAGAGAGAGGRTAVPAPDEAAEVLIESPQGQLALLAQVLEALEEMDESGWTSLAETIIAEQRSLGLSTAVWDRVHGHIWALNDKPPGDANYGGKHAFDSLKKLKEAIACTMSELGTPYCSVEDDGTITFRRPL